MTHILITSSVLIAVILLVRRLFRGKVSHKLLYCAWLLVAARLLIPFQFGQWDFSIHTLTDNIENRSQTVQQAQITLQEPVAGPSRSEIYQQLAQEYIQQGFDPVSPEIQAQIALQIEEQITAPTVSQVLTAVWLSGMAVMAVWFLTANLIYLRRAKRGTVPFAANAPVPVRVSKNVPTPCLAGLFRPVIYLTPASTETPEMTRHVLTHELTHLRHADHVWSLVRCVCLCVYWFDPLVWIAASQSRRDCELACDESALQSLGDGERIAYGQTLLATVTRSVSPAHLLQTATAMNESKKQLKERVCFIVKKPKNLLIAAVCLVLIAAFAAGCAFTGSSAETTTPTEPVETTAPSNYNDIPTIPQQSEPKDDTSDELYTMPAGKKPVFSADTPQEDIYGTWENLVCENDYTLFTYSLTLNNDGTAEYSWGYYGSEVIEAMSGTWRPAGSEYEPNEYILEMVPIGGSRHSDGVRTYDYYGVYRIVCSEDGSAIQATWVNGSPLFHFYRETGMVLYRFASYGEYQEFFKPMIDAFFEYKNARRSISTQGAP